MSQEKAAVNPIQKCGCGKSLHMPYCDGSHNRSEKQYAEWKRQIDLEQQKSDSIKK